MFWHRTELLIPGLMSALKLPVYGPSRQSIGCRRSGASPFIRPLITRSVILMSLTFSYLPFLTRDNSLVSSSKLIGADRHARLKGA